LLHAIMRKLPKESMNKWLEVLRIGFSAYLSQFVDRFPVD